MSTSQRLELAAGAVERWVQELGPQQARQALLGFGLWSPSDGIAPAEDLDAAYILAQRTLGVGRQAIAFEPQGRALICRLIYGNQLIIATAQPHALALTRAVLCAAYKAQLR